jgi:hypothetical protein
MLVKPPPGFFLFHRFIFMKSRQFILVAALAILFSTPLFSQSGSGVTYIIIRLDGLWDYTRNKNFIRINAEAGNPAASELYNLKEYISAKKAVNSGASFYSEKNDTTSVYFNYFLTATEVMQFFADHSWELITVSNEITSSYDNIQSGDKLVPVPRVFSRAVYYFRKEVSK